MLCSSVRSSAGSLNITMCKASFGLYLLLGLVAWSYAHSMPMQYECLCPRTLITRPVCADDGVTYDSQCLMTCHGAGKLHGGECVGGLTCSGRCSLRSNRLRYQAEVCGSDGNTYASLCHLACTLGVTKAYNGPCNLPACIAHCPAKLHRVCGSNGVTYFNECYLRCSRGVQKAQDGPCPSHACLHYCPKERELVCGTDKKTYNNECCLNCLKVTKLHEGPCDTPPDPYYVCNKRCRHLGWRPVCGDTEAGEVTYINQCFLTCNSERSQSSITKKKDGTCGPCVCRRETKLVCGTDNKVYNNICELQCQGVEKLSDGPCPRKLTEYERCEQSCHCNIDPVCGKDGNLYKNKCLMECAKVELRNNGLCTNKHYESEDSSGGESNGGQTSHSSGGESYMY